MSDVFAAELPALSMTIFVNDQPRGLTPDTNLAVLLADLGLSDRRGIAVAHNGVVVPRNIWPTCRLTAGDRVIVIQATQGG